ncbi:hypothetical protein [Culturomica sp.]|uniref:hypothetical protein n=1 Tax=Culturomica sp. TaxID=1926652 RepID=UPI000E9473D7|nr:hypothetical protein [Culturomica sp.]HBO25333.1 hypothetical protein [Culturomica sp.]
MMKKKNLRKIFSVLIILLFFYLFYSFVVYEIKVYVLKNTLFVSQLWGAYDAFYRKNEYYPTQQDELMKFVSDVEYPGLKKQIKYFKCTVLVKKDTLYIYDYGFNGVNDHMEPYIDNINKITFIDVFFRKKGDILLVKQPVLKYQKIEMEKIDGEKPIPPLKQKSRK